MNKVLEALNNLSLTITPTENAANAEGGAAGANGEAAGEQNTEVKTPKVVNLSVELIKYSDKAAKKTADSADAAPGAGAAATTVNGGEAAAAGGDASSARIESVDTTTV